MTSPGTPPTLDPGAASPRLIIGLPVFNGMPHLREAVKSIQSQTIANFRCIVIDDGSTDGTADYLDTIDDERFTVVHQANRGLVASLNTILEMCPAGSWLVRQDADDISAPDRLERVLPWLRDGVSLVHTAAEYLGSPGGHLRFRSSPMSGSEAAAFVRGGRLLSVCHPTAVINVDTSRQIGGYRDLLRVEDLDLWWRLALAGDVVFLADSTVQYRVTEAGVSQSALERQAIHALYVQYLLLSDLRGLAPMTFAEVEPVLHAMLDGSELRFRSHIRDAQIAYQSGRRSIAARSVALAVWSSPSSFASRVKDEVRHRVRGAAPIGAGAPPAHFHRFSAALWPNGDEPNSVTAINLPSGRRALRVNVWGAEVALLDAEELTDEVTTLVRAGDRALVSNHNLHSIALLHEHPDLGAFNALATFSFIDGMSLVGLGRVLGLPTRRIHRTTYFDWMPLLFARANDEAWTIAHVGCHDDTNLLATAWISAHFPSIEVVHHHGYFDVDSQDENANVLSWLHTVDPDLLFVGMSMPRQERWIRDNWNSLPRSVVLNSGGFFALLGGEQAVPPRWLGRIGFEWLGRLAMNPSRTWRRYLVEPVTLVARRAPWR